MRRQPPDPTGNTIRVTVSLAPGRLAKLDRIARNRNLTRSAALAHILDRLKDQT